MSLGGAIYLQKELVRKFIVFIDLTNDSFRFACDVLYRVAGSETSSTALTFTLMYLVKNTEKLAKLQEELDLATASNAPGVLPSYDQVRNLPYLTGCINEALRLRPVAATGN